MAGQPESGRRPAGRDLPRTPRRARLLRPRWLLTAVLVTTPFGIVCGGASSSIPGGPAPGDPGAPLLVRGVEPPAPAPAPAEGLVFPPPGVARAPREPLPEGRDAGIAPKLTVTQPSLDSSGAFEVVGRTFQIVFSRPVAMPGATGGASGRWSKPRPAAPGTVRLSPEVPVAVSWIDERTLEVTAVGQFEKGRTYEVEIGKLTSTTGEALEGGGWKAKLDATPSVTIAGKVLGYVPVPGALRTIAAHPSDGSTVPRQPELAVLYDQPIAIAAARKLVRIEDGDGKEIPVVLDHPRGKAFQGVSVDPRMVVLVRPAAPLAPGQGFTLTAESQVPGAADARVRTASFRVAEPFQQTQVECGHGWDDSPCPTEDGKLWMSGHALHVRFNNAIAGDDRAIARRVQVTPALRNLSVESESWDGARVVLSGAFEPSTTYRIVMAGLTDEYGGRLAAPVRLTVRTRPVGASITMPDGVLLLDPATAKRFPVTTRNVVEAELLAWPVTAGDAAAFEAALGRARSHQVPDGDAPIRIPVAIEDPRRDALVTTELDLAAKLSRGQSYLATARAVKLAEGAEAMRFPGGSAAEKPSVALLSAASATSLSVHARALPDATLVHVARLVGGEPVAGAEVRLEGAPGTGGAGVSVKTDAHGVALLRGEGSGRIRVEAAGETAFLPMDEGGVTAKQLFPDLAGGRGGSGDEDEEEKRREQAGGGAGPRAMIVTDRGIYRPGSTVWIKASLRRPEGDRLAPVAGAPVRLRVVGPTGEEVYSEVATTNDMGSVASKFEAPADGKVGRHQIRVEAAEGGALLASSIVQVAEFEPPRFAVDVDAAETGAGMRASIRGRYLFGAPMDGANVSWTLRREPVPFPSGPLTEAGLVFRKQRSWWDGDDDEKARWSRAGEGQLAADGTLSVEQALPMDGADGPQAFVLEADVTDSSHRHIAGRGRMVKHPAPRYAGLRVAASWVGVGEAIPVELGAIDGAGQPVVGARVTALLARVDWRYGQRRGSGGQVRWEWSRQRTEVGRCEVKSAVGVARCTLTPASTGDYEIRAEVDGRPGGVASVWAWREGRDGRDGDQARVPFPDQGRKVLLATDKARYAPGETAKILVRSPYRAATAILTVEQGGLLEHRSVRVQGSSAVLEVPLTAGHAPHAHAAVTLLPVGEPGAAGADYRIGAVRLPVSLAGARLDLAIRSDKATYEPGEEAEVVVEVKDGGASGTRGTPVEGAEVALAVVDEGVLRLTAFHPPDPVLALRPGQRLVFHLRDSREGLADLLERSHVAGDGGGAERATIDRARKDFVDTALWRPDLRTDAAGRATVRFKLPDNLTQFRVMAVALDRGGKGASAEGDFTVRKPLMIAPVVPRFAARGDKLEVAAMVHNNTEAAVEAAVRLGERSAKVTVSPGSRSRVAFPFEAKAIGEEVLAFALADGAGKVRDRVEARLRVQEPGLAERPHLEGSFVGARAQEIALAVPASVDLREGESLRVQVGQHLWPELGARLEYLLDYPHGCVEQTTSSTLPLIAARTILPRIGVASMSEGDLKVRIQAGLERLASMRTASGGLGYWPGDDEPNVYGTAYAIRAVLLAKQAGVEPPKGLLEGMQRFLADQLLDGWVAPEVRAAIAESLGEAGALPASAADTLHDTRGKQSVFGLSSLAIALSTLRGQEDRVASLLDAVEASFDAEGKLTAAPKSNDFHYYGSPTRTRAQAAIALSRLRRKAKVLPLLLQDLVRETEAYTTQATSYALLAVASQLEGNVAEGVPVGVVLDGEAIAPARDLGFGSKEFRIPLEKLRGRKATLRITGEGDVAVAYQMSAAWRRPLAGSETLAATRAPRGPSVYRVFTDAKGHPIDLAKVSAGDLVRVALLVKLPVDQIGKERTGYVAVTDRLPAGFEPVQPELATVTSAPDLDVRHPFASELRYGNEASHVELRDDRVHVYFDQVYGRTVAATYLARATTPGEFVLPPAAAELMYEGDSAGYSEAGRVVIR